MTRPPTLPSEDAQAVVETSGGLLDELEESLHEFEKELYVLATAVSDWPAGSAGCSEAEALEWHLNDTARRLQAARDACGAARRWSTRLLAEDLGSQQPGRREAKGAVDRPGVLRRTFDRLEAGA